MAELLKGIDTDVFVQRLEADTVIKPFKSSDEDFDKFLLKKAKNYQAQKLAVTYLLETETETVAFFSLAHDCVRRDISRTNLSEYERNIWRVIDQKIPRKKQRHYYPAIKIVQLAVDTKYEGNGFGRLIINIVKDMYGKAEQRAGCRFISVDAMQKVTDFYIKNNFNFLTEKDEERLQRAMCLDLHTL